MKFKLEIDCDNAAFEDCGIGPELNRILSQLGNKLSRFDDKDLLIVALPVLDLNGNKVGTATFSGEES